MANNNSISESLSNDQIIALLQMLFVNMNNLDRLYYDLFINDTPMMLTLERYNADGVLQKYSIPNRAKDRLEERVVQGRGEPEGAKIANAGTVYIDVLTNNVWIKAVDGGANNWVKLYTPANFVDGKEYLAPDGDASKLTGFSASNFSGGVLSVKCGGTGVQGTLDGLVKGRGPEQEFVTAIPNIDYMSPNAFVGSLGIFMTSNIPSGWLVCNGASYSEEDYPALASALSNTFPNNEYIDENGNVLPSTDQSGVGLFYVPDFRNRYIRGFLAGVIGDFQSGAIPNIHGNFFNSRAHETQYDQDPTGAFYVKNNEYGGTGSAVGTGSRSELVTFDASRGQLAPEGVDQTYLESENSVYKDGINEVRVNNLSAKICIYAGLIGQEY